MKHQVLLLAGAAGGVGSAVARAAHQAGASLVIQGRRRAELESLASSLGEPAPRLLVGDLSAPGEAERLLSELVAATGRLDALVSTIGGIDPEWPRISQTSDEAFEKLLDMNVKGAFRLARAAVKVMQPGGRIVFTASRGGLQPGGGGAYDVSKAALGALISVLAADLKEEGIRVNAVAPSIINTEANRRAMPGADTSRWVSPEEVAEALLFLASPASSGVTGAIVPAFGRL
jgi:NAD(P)-dependent dehydrogenase (short-subunit alcohol dehydrogenase family)